MSWKNEDCVCAKNTSMASLEVPYNQFPRSGEMKIFQCPRCGQRWFCYNDHFRLWGKVEDDLTWKFMVNGVKDATYSIGGVCVIAPGYEQFAIDPISEVCADRVSWPAVKMELILGSRTAVIQWKGEYDLGNIFGYQFMFPILSDLDRYFEKKSSLRVAFIGQIKHWPDSNQARKMAEDFDDPEMERHIVHLMSADHAQKYDDGSIGPASFISEIVLLGDPNVGIIRPANFYDYSVADMVIEMFDEKNKV